MDQITLGRERRRQLAKERLSTNQPRCHCGEDDWRCLQLISNPDVTNDNSANIIICRSCRCKQRPIPRRHKITAQRACLVCTEADPRCLELHHIAGRAFANDCVTVCSNCHAKLSDMRKEHLQ
jgi:hypothetical protein